MDIHESTLFLSYQVHSTSTATRFIQPLWKYDLSLKLEQFFQCEMFSMPQADSIKLYGGIIISNPVFEKNEPVRIDTQVSKGLRNKFCIISGSINWITGRGFIDTRTVKPGQPSQDINFQSRTLENCVAFFQTINHAYEDDFFINISYLILMNLHSEEKMANPKYTKHPHSSSRLPHLGRAKLNTFVKTIST